MATEVSGLNGRRQRVAVVGAGAAGLTAARLIDQRHEVVLFDAGPRPGGHVYTVEVPDGPDAGTAVDMGFIVFNRRNYPLFERLIDSLGVTVQDSDMSFGFHCRETGAQYAGTGLNGLFCRRRNIVAPAHWRLLQGIRAFGRRGRHALAQKELGVESLGEYLAATSCPRRVVEDFVLPMGAAIWSSSRDDIRAFPARTFLRFFDNHGLLGLADRPQWLTIAGGSRRYVDALLGEFSGELRAACPVHQVRRRDTGVEVRTAEEPPETFDAVVVATHADTALRILADADDDERRLLGAWSYSRNETVLHTDAGLLPPRRRAWASWNYQRAARARSNAAVNVTYHMNRLQRLDTQADYFVSLNPARPPRAEHVVHTTTFTHPVYSRASVATQAELPGLNGRRRTWFCGAYFRNGFHEDAVAAGAAVAADFGTPL